LEEIQASRWRRKERGMKIIIDIPDDFAHDEFDLEIRIPEVLYDWGVDFESKVLGGDISIKVTGPLAAEDEEDEEESEDE
jgi:hypothetical protein